MKKTTAIMAIIAAMTFSAPIVMAQCPAKGCTDKAKQEKKCDGEKKKCDGEKKACSGEKKACTGEKKACTADK